MIAVFYDGHDGQTYRFVPIDMSNQRALPSGGGVILIAIQGMPVYISWAAGISEYVRRADIWNAARSHHGATQLYVIPSGNVPWCQTAATSLRARYKPAMN